MKWESINDHFALDMPAGSQIKSARPIGDKLARQIEMLSDKPVGWLDEPRKDAAPTSVEAAFLELALAAWRATNSAGRKALREQLKSMAERPS